MNVRVFVVTALLLVAGAAQAGEKFYKWKDESGAWHYTQTPPPAGAKSENVEVTGGAGPSSGAAAAPASGDVAATPTPAAADSAGAGTGNLSVAQNADSKAQCEKARAYATQLNDNPYIASDANKDGEPELMSDAQRQREIDRAQMAVKLSCE